MSKQRYGMIETISGMVYCLYKDESQWNEMRHDVDKKKGFKEEWNERSRKMRKKLFCGI